MYWGKFLVFICWAMTFVISMLGCSYNFTELQSQNSIIFESGQDQRQQEAIKPKNQDDFLKKEITSLIEARDLEGLVRIMNNLQSQRNSEYDYLLADLCSSFNSYDFNNDKQYLYARDCSKYLLKNSD